MSSHPVQLQIERSTRVPRVQVVIRLVIVLALGLISWSSIYWLLYLVLPALVALEVVQKGSEQYQQGDAPRLLQGLRWLASAYAYLFFLSNVLPTAQGGPVDLHVDVTGRPTPGSALLRLVTSLPALLLVAVLSLAATLVWTLIAIWALLTENVPHALADFMALALRVKLRLIAYHLSLVDRYPSLADTSLGSEATAQSS